MCQKYYEGLEVSRNRHSEYLRSIEKWCEIVLRLTITDIKVWNFSKILVYVPLSTSKVVHDILHKKHGIQVASRVTKGLKT